MRGQPERNTRNVALIRKLRVSLMCLAYFLTCYQWVFEQPDTGRRSVDWYRNQMSVLYLKDEMVRIFEYPKLNISTTYAIPPLVITNRYV